MFRNWGRRKRDADTRVADDDAGTRASFDSTGKRKSFKRILSRFADRTSMVGVPYISNARFWWAKAIWSVLLLCAIGAMSLHLWYLLSQWYSYPKTTTISLGFDKLPFPQITICNTNVMHKGRLEKYNGASELKELVNDLDPRNLVPDQYNPINDPYTTTGSPADSTNSQNNQVTPIRASNGSSSTSAPEAANMGLLKRRKRFVSNYGDVNKTKYDTTNTDVDSYLFDDEEYDSPVDEQTDILNIFTDLFMEIDKSDREDLGHDINDMLVGCTFNGRTCNSSLFQLHQTSEYGNCYTISSKRFISIKPGPKSGLSLVLFLETSAYLHGITTGYGIRLQIQEGGTYPFPGDEGHFISAATETDIGIRLLQIGRLGGKFGSCDSGAEFKRLYNLTYTRRVCLLDCQISAVIKNCGCYDYEWEEFAVARNKSLKPCEDEAEMLCLIDTLVKYYDGQMQCTCHNPCKETDYVKTISQRQWPTDEYATVLLQWVCEWSPDTCKHLKNKTDYLSEISKNFVKVNIYYEDLNFEKITETEQIEIQQFLSDVGGAIGLWIGLSILSLCELLHLFVELSYYCTHKTMIQKEKQTTRSRETNDDGKSNSTVKKADLQFSDPFRGIYDKHELGNLEPDRRGYYQPRSNQSYRQYSDHSNDNRFHRARNDISRDNRYISDPDKNVRSRSEDRRSWLY